MNNQEYFGLLAQKFDAAYRIAEQARSKGRDPELHVEVRPAPDLASRVEGIIGMSGIAELIKSKNSKSRQELAFEMVKEICTNQRFESNVRTRLTLAVRVGLSILTEGILVAPTEGMQGVELHKNPDGSDYISVMYAGPIRGAGGTSAALSVALADYGRKILGIGAYKAQQSEIERYLEEIMLYHSRVARLQYLPSEDDIRIILQNCPVCVDGVPTEDLEIGIHRNIKRLDANGKQVMITNKIRGGIGLVLCEGIAQKAKSVLKYTKTVDLNWTWLNNVIKVDKAPSPTEKIDSKKEAVFLQELVAGRPVLAYPDYPGSFRLRYGRSRLTGIAAKGFSPATMMLLEEFISTGTQIKVEKPGKGCIAMPVDSIEGPFVKLLTGEAFRVNTIEKALDVKGKISKILSVGDILITYGDFKKTNTPLQPTSYVEEYWYEELLAAGFSGQMPDVKTFGDALELSKKYGVPMHPLFIYEYQDITKDELKSIAKAILSSGIAGKSINDISALELGKNGDMDSLRPAIERLCIPHFDSGIVIRIEGEDARCLISSLGFVDNDGKTDFSDKIPDSYDAFESALEALNSVSKFKINKRSTRVGGRIGRPEKAKERLMKPAPNILFPVGEFGGKERSVYKAYIVDKKRFGLPKIEVNLPKYRCMVGKEITETVFCEKHNSRSMIERVCRVCGRDGTLEICAQCGNKTIGYDIRKVDLAESLDKALSNLGLQSAPKAFKGVKGLSSLDKMPEPLEKGVLRSTFGVSIFKDGTARFDATDAPITHFYPKEVGTSVEKLKELGYTLDYEGRPLENDDQLLELKHQDTIINRRGAEYMLSVAKFVDELLVRYYKMEPFYNVKSAEDMIGQFIVSLSPHTSAGVLGRVVGLTDASVGLAHPYTICARRRNCDGDEDTIMLLLDMLINFSRRYLPTTVGGTMDAPLILTVHVAPEEVDDEVHSMEVVEHYGLAFYKKTLEYASPGEVSVELVSDRLNRDEVFHDIRFTHISSAHAVADAPKRSMYTKLKTMHEKVDMQFSLADKLSCVNKTDTARRLILSHFIPDLMGNLHSYSKQTFRCVSCNAKYRRVPLIGKCTRCQGKLLLTINRGGIEKYLTMAIDLGNRYDVEPYIKQRLTLLKDEIEDIFGGLESVGEFGAKQFNLAKFM
jgi:DNA polymerase II large subunit